jgi:hypothetical protein
MSIHNMPGYHPGESGSKSRPGANKPSTNPFSMV